MVENLLFGRSAAPEELPQQVSSTHVHATCGKARRLPESFKKIAYQRVEIRVLLPQVFDLADGVDDRRMVLAAEAPAYLGQ